MLFSRISRILSVCCLCILVPLSSFAAAGQWTTTWTASAHGPYPSGNASAQPDQRLSFPDAAVGARDQSFRMIVMPDMWGESLRVRFTNAWGTKPVTLDGVYVGVQLSGSAVMAKTNVKVLFGGKSELRLAPGAVAWSDAVSLPFADNPSSLDGRKLAVSFHVAGESGPMTWHAKAMQTSYVTLPGAGSRGHEESEASFIQPVASWFFVDAVDMMLPDARTIVAFGDSITDGTASTLNGDDRWPNVLSRRMREQHGRKISVVNAGIGGNQIIGPRDYTPYTPQKPYQGGPAALSRIERDVISLSNVATVIWFEGINDFSKNGNAEAQDVIEGMRKGVALLRSKLPGVRVVGATVTSTLGSTSKAHGSKEQDDKRQTLNEFIRTSGLFDAVLDFDKVLLDPATGGLKPEFVPESTCGGPGDRVHPNRLGYVTLGMSIDLKAVLPKMEGK
ncbi:MAG: GDSL-type esterase/lipase family protein [Desulfovibrio sp.]|jgi:lysophospholipase L1-like esterase|nr:GDSL-type esterase/lipase family protein [Desulfovibrio sp.]